MTGRSVFRLHIRSTIRHVVQEEAEAFCLDWEYYGDGTAKLLDQFNRRRCRWMRVGEEDAVPGKIVSNFRASKTLNPVADEAAVRFGLVLVARGRSTPGYEYVLRSRSSGRKVVCSVKSGGSAVEMDRLPRSAEVDAFAYGDNRSGAPRDDITWITTTDLVTFVEERPEVLPDRVHYWLGAR